MITGKARESFDSFDLYAGIVEAKRVLGVNPTVEQRAEWYGRDLTEKEKENPDIEYTGETTEGDKKIDLVFYIETDHPKNKVQKYRVELVNKERLNKDETKFQLINQTGDTAYIGMTEDGEPDYDNLYDWFTNFQDKDGENLAPKKVRKALVGEEQLMKLLKAALKINKKDVDTSIVYDYKKFFKGDVKDLNADLQNKSFIQPFALGVDVTKSKEGDKYYQNVYGKRFLPAGITKYITNKNFPNKYMADEWKRFQEDVNGEYGTKGHLPFEKLSIYDPSKDEANMEGAIASGDVKVGSKYD